MHFISSRNLSESNYNGCFGDLDVDGFVIPADRGFVSANIGQTDPENICRFDVDGNGFITPTDRGFISANLTPLCTSLPDYMNGRGMNGGELDTRFGAIGYFQGVDTECSMISCN